MTFFKKQRGFVNLDGLVTVFYLAAVGIVAIICGICWALYFILQNLHFA